MKYVDENGEEREIVNIGMYDEEEIHEGCTVQILRNSVTGEISIGWWYGDAKDKPVIDPMGLPC